jgi:hypothetical protein
MIVLVQFLFSIFVTSVVWLGGTSLSFLIYSTLYSPEKLHAIATVALEHQALRAMLTAMSSDPVFLGSAILAGALIILYDKLLLVELIVLWDRQDRQNSKT